MGQTGKGSWSKCHLNWDRVGGVQPEAWLSAGAPALPAGQWRALTSSPGQEWIPAQFSQPFLGPETIATQTITKTTIMNTANYSFFNMQEMALVILHAFFSVFTVRFIILSGPLYKRGNKGSKRSNSLLLRPHDGWVGESACEPSSSRKTRLPPGRSISAVWVSVPVAQTMPCLLALPQRGMPSIPLQAIRIQMAGSDELEETGKGKREDGREER